MKKLFLVTLLALLTLSVQGQKTHLKFMGIPLTGTINNFQTKLSAKGIKVDQKVNKMVTEGARVFKGTFSGEDAIIFIYYDVKTKIVYRAKVVIKCFNADNYKEKFYALKNNLSKKYADAYKYEDEQNGQPEVVFMVSASDGTEIGDIGLYAGKKLYSFTDEIDMHLDYSDYANDKSHKSNNMDDL